MSGKYGIPYFANFIGSDLRPDDVRSMCPLTTDTKIVVKIDNEQPETKEIGLLYGLQRKSRVEVWNGETWVEAKVNKQPKTTILEITFTNGAVVKMGELHLQPVLDRGVLAAYELKVNDLLPFAKNGELNLTEGAPDFEDEEFVYFKIKEIKVSSTDDDSIYCFEVQDNKHLFALENGLITHNCRLRLDLSELRRKNGGLFGSGDSTGSVSVTTLNLPRIGYESQTEEEFFQILSERLELAKKASEQRRAWLQENVIEKNLIPAFMTYVGTIDNHFSTIGIVGMNEMCENFLGVGIDTPEGKEFALKVGDFIRTKIQAFQEETGYLYNYEATPKICGPLAA